MTLAIQNTRVGPLPALSVRVETATPSSIAYPRWKRGLDVIVALLALAFVAPLIVLVAALIAMDGGPVFFAHARIGTFGKTFHVYKFRTMFTNADARLESLLAVDSQARSEWEISQKLRQDPRVTAVGRFLRKSSIDELPQLINVLRGEMSIIGPRPIVQAEASRYGRYLQHYERTRPGITGLWQVSGRNNLSYRRRVALDTLYSRKIGDVRMDLVILLKTIPAVLFSKGSY